MTKTLIWVLVGVLAVAGLGAVAFMEFAPRAQPQDDAAAAEARGGVGAVPAATTPSAAVVLAPASASTEVPATSTADSVQKASPTIDDLIQDAAAYDGVAVSLTGTILTQCTAGCEFALSDDTGVLSVQLEGRGKDRLLPLGKVGKTIAVQGTFRASPRPQIVIEDPSGWQFVK